MWAKHKQKSGFTIVELLIVIVVIAILAAISVIAYNGIQNRSKNAQTQQTASAWIKALQMYKADNSRWPGGFVCLGKGYKFGPRGTDDSGTAACRQTVSNNALESTAFNTTMAAYIGSTIPTPTMTTAYGSDTNWYRGITYVYGGGSGTDVYLHVAYAGNSGTCPTISGVNGTATILSENYLCYYSLGATTDT